jgi:hypothetical protein
MLDASWFGWRFEKDYKFVFEKNKWDKIVIIISLAGYGDAKKIDITTQSE